MHLKSLPVLALVLLAGCAARRIPGTNIDDTSDTRAILDLMDRYRAAVEAKDTETVVSLVDETFKDDAGTGSPDDDLDYAGLQKRLPERFAKLDNVKLNIDVRKIVVANDTASAVYNFTMTWKMPQLSQKPYMETGIEEMSFRRVGGKWRIASGV